MKEIDRIQEEYEQERFMVKMNQIIDRKLCAFRGMQRTHRHNETEKRKRRVREERKKCEKVTKSEVTKPKMTRSQERVIPVTWKPSTTKEDIEKKLKLKGIKLKSRIRKKTKMVTWRKGGPPKEVVIFFVFEFMV